MDFTSLNPDVLRELLKLSEQKVSLVKQIEAIDSRIAALSSGKATASTGKRGRPAKADKPAQAPKAAKGKRGRPAKSTAAGTEKAPKAARGKRGALKTDIMELLAKAGSEGISVKDISTKLGVKNQNVHVWFSTTGKKMPEIAKVGEARYALAPAAAASEAAPASTEAPAA